MSTRASDRVSFVALLIALASIFVAIQALRNDGDSNTAELSSISTLDKLVEEKVLRAGYVVYPPTVVATEEPGEPSGFLVEISNEIAERAEFEILFEETTFDDFKAGLLLGKYDLIVAGIFQTTPRATELRFTDPIMYWSGVSAIAAEGREGEFTTLSDLNRPEVRVAVTAGTAEHEFVERELPEATLIPLTNSDISLTLSEVLAGRSDVAFSDAVTARNFASTQSGVAPLFGGTQFNSFATGFVVRMEDEELAEFLNTSLEALALDGTISDLSAKYAGSEVWQLPEEPWQ